MYITKDTVLLLAESLQLSEGKMQRIRDVVHFMDDEDLQMLNRMLTKIQSEKVAKMKEEIALREDANNKYKFFKRTLAGRENAAVEAAAHEKTSAEADSLLDNLN